MKPTYRTEWKDQRGSKPAGWYATVNFAVGKLTCEIIAGPHPDNISAKRAGMEAVAAA